MAYKIDMNLCNGCTACEPECPNEAIIPHKGLYKILPEKCTECIGHHDEAQCLAVCPIDDAVLIDESVPRYQA